MFLPIGDNIQKRDLPVIPFVLIAANVLVYAYQLRILFTDPSGVEAEYAFVLTWGLVPADLAQWQVIGVLTYMFLHGGLMHIAGNMIVLWAFACSLEVGLGRWTLLGFYTLFGVVGGLAHAVADWSSEIPLVGASGAIAGLIGAYTVLYGPLSKIHTLVFFFFRVFKVEVPAMLFGVGWFGLQLLEASNDPEGMSRVAWYAHIGGFLAGVVVALVCRNETVCHVKHDRQGNLVFEDAAESVPTSDMEPIVLDEALDYPLPPTCPYCDQGLVDKHRLAYNLARCGNSSCERMIYLEPSLPSAPVLSK